MLSATNDAFTDQDMVVVVTTDRYGLPKSQRPLPSNIRHEPYWPGLAMAEPCDALIHHGGYGYCQTALFAGKPAVIFPTFPARESNARRVVGTEADLIVPVELGAGRKHADADALRGAENPHYASNRRNCKAGRPPRPALSKRAP